MRQSRWGSFIEACINVAIGFWINFFANLLIFPLFGFHITLGENFIMGLAYTVISVARSYIVRRWFEGRIHKAAQRFAGGIDEIPTQGRGQRAYAGRVTKGRSAGLTQAKATVVNRPRQRIKATKTSV